jgi:uncharacterized membrane protein
MAIHLHALSARSLHGGVAVAAAVALAVGVAAQASPLRELAPVLAWDAGVLAFVGLMLRATTGYGEAEMAHKALHRAPTSGQLAAIALVAAGFGIYAIFLLIEAAGSAPRLSRGLYLAVGVATTALSWALVHLLFALDYARIYCATAESGASPAGGLAFPGTHPPNYWDFLYRMLA